MARIYSTAPAWTGTIGSGGVPDASTTTIPLSSATGLTDGAYYVLSIDRVDASGKKTPAKWEVVAGQLSGTNLINCTRGVEGTAQAHSAGATVEVLFTSYHWEQLKEYLENDYILEKKASGSDINTGTEDAKIVTPKAIADSNVIFKPGMIIPYAGSSAPSGWLICDGSAVSRTTYSALFAVIGTTYGAGDGSTTFNLPNLKGRVPAGLDTSQTEFDTLGKTGGAKTHTLTVNEMPSHYHNSNYYMWNSNSGDLATYFNAGSGYGINTFNNNLPTSSTGGNQPHNNLQPYITLNYIIKY